MLWLKPPPRPLLLNPPRDPNPLPLKPDPLEDSELPIDELDWIGADWDGGPWEACWICAGGPVVTTWTLFPLWGVTGTAAETAFSVPSDDGAEVATILLSFGGAWL